ncbi:MAG: magnesium transporter [Bacilli bacterium]|nr:magnesium transporter [Bacilli bacterium]
MENEEREDLLPSVAKITEQELEEMIKAKNASALREVFINVPTIDIADAADNLDPKDLIYIFRTVESSYTADFFDDLSIETKEALISTMTNKELVEIINASYADDIVDFLVEMPANLASKVLKAADKEMRADINKLLKYEDDTAGSIMTTEYLEFLDSTTVEKTIDVIREKGKDAETVYTIFVRNASRHFVGTVNLDDLIFAKPTQTLEEIMNRDIVSVNTNTDQEEVAKTFRRYDLNALAVLNNDERIVGIITIDDAVDVMEEENTEDFARISKMEAIDKPYLEVSPWQNAKKCFPWLIVLLVLGTFTTMVLNRLENQAIFLMIPLLIAFIPTLMDTSGNAGGQTTGMMIRSLALGEVTPKDIIKVLFKELCSALIVGLFVGSFAFIWIIIEEYTGVVSLGQIKGYDFAGVNIWNGNCWTPEFAGIAIRTAGLTAITMFFAIVLSKSIGTILPMFAAAIKKDPALISQPMLTTIMDVTTLIVYFGISCLFFTEFL